MANFRLKRDGSKRYWYVFWSEGRRTKRATTGTADRKQAERVLAILIQEHHTPKNANPDEISIASVLQRYYDGHGAELPSALQIDIYVRRLLEYWGDANVDVLTLEGITAYRKKVVVEGLSLSTVNRRLSCLRAALNYAKANGRLATVPHIPTYEEPAPRSEFLTRPQAAKLLWATRGTPHLTMFVRLALYTGARRGAVCDLTWDRVDLETGWVDFRLPGVNHGRKKRPEAPIAGVLLRALRTAHKKAHSEFVVAYKGEGVANLRRAFATACAKAGLKGITPHVLKHTAITWGLRNASVWDVSGATATSVDTIMRVYGKHVDEDMRRTANAMARGR